ncbi:hypothetical protein [Halalkalicoccus subterraneus]|nr:hypothetical protein [Halalkalicoccus subterraneus]
MSSTEFHVTCPHCGTATPTTAESTLPSDRLQGTDDRCSNCESDFELYYY